MRDHSMPTIGIMAAGAAGPVEDFKAGMRECGFVEGQNIRFEPRVAHGDSARLSCFASELVRASVDLIAAIGAVTARAAHEATIRIPIVYGVVVDPVSDGLATLSGMPRGNMTGITTFDSGQAGLQMTLLRSIKPDLARIALLADLGVSDCLANANTFAAQEAGLRPQILRIDGSDPDFESAFAAMHHEGAQALIALEHPVNGANAARIVELALASRLPAILARDQAGAGGLFSYGTSLRHAAHQMARHASRILCGDEPTDLQIETLHRPELLVNMKTARSLGIRVPPDILSRALQLME